VQRTADLLALNQVNVDQTNLNENATSKIKDEISSHHNDNIVVQED